MGERPAPRPLRRRRIIERPRLIRALDRSQARVRTLVAAAGYGKTILAEQWAQGEGRRIAWFRARRSAIDVAVLARGVSAAAREIVPGAGRRLEERLAVTQDPEREAVVLAEILSTDLCDWPADGWIVIDDYQHVGASAAGEAFVETLVNRTPVQLLIASRERPAWVSGRTILYGSVLEITQTALAMSADEAEEMLAGSRPGLSAGLIAVADGWPAVIGLASIADAQPSGDVEVPEELYEFFADEVYRSLEEPVRTGLAILAGLPLLDRSLVSELLGRKVGSLVCERTLGLGVVDEREGRLELHPLAAAFFEQRARDHHAAALHEVARRALTIYREGREWDAAFDAVDRFGFDEHLEPLLTESLDELLNAGRLATLERTVERRDPVRAGVSPLLAVVRAEVALRTGKHVVAQTVATKALSDLSSGPADFRHRALIVAARAAHVGSREEDALALFRQAEREADGGRWERESIWGQLTAAAALELDVAHELMARVESSASPSDPAEIVRLADKRLALGFRFGAIAHLDEARRVTELVPEVADPNARCSFRCTFAYTLNLAARYDHALSEAMELLREAREYRIDFALTYGHLMAATAFAGRKEYDAAHEELRLSEGAARQCNDDFGSQAVYAARVRVMLQEGLVADACTIEPPPLAGALPGMRAEVLGSRALALASLGRLDEARTMASDAARSSAAIEIRVLEAAVVAVAGLKGREAGHLRSVEHLLDVAYESGAVDLAVTAYRSSSELLVALLTDPLTVERTVFLVRRAGDEELASALGCLTTGVLDPLATLTPRERVVHDLVCEGLSNREIAQRLYVAPSTVKAHLNHIYDKLGVRNRTALAISRAKLGGAGD